MRRVLVLALSTATLLLTACPSPPKNGECKSSEDCAAQAGFGKVCVSGKCAECAADADCKAGFACAANRCEPKPAEALPVKAEPKAECVADGECGSGKGCQAGKCVSTIEPACADASAFTINFGFDQSSISADAAAVLKRLAVCHRKYPAKHFVAEGHCDDRGTTGYNLALGKKRAEAVKKYLADLGVDAAIDSNTFGKEKPLCRESTESCWARNRRVEVVIER